jgi:hypothetical protein
MEYKEQKDKNEMPPYGNPGAAELSKKVRNSLPADKKGPNEFYDPNR